MKIQNFKIVRDKFKNKVETRIIKKIGNKIFYYQVYYLNVKWNIIPDQIKTELWNRYANSKLQNSSKYTKIPG